jgi:hypothetical protein
MVQIFEALILPLVMLGYMNIQNTLGTVQEVKTDMQVPKISILLSNFDGT